MKIKQLRQKVLEKNPDEFYFGMMSRNGPSTTGKNSTGTVNGNRGNAVLSQDASRLFKTQDLGYIRTMRNKTQKEVTELEAAIMGITGEGTKIVFVDNEEEQRENAEREDIDMDDESDGWDDMVEEEGMDVEARQRRRLQQRERSKLETRLNAARQRLKALADAEEALDLQRAKMAKSPTVGGINKNGVKFKIRERKR